MHSVSSNAVFNTVFPDYASGNQFTTSATSYTATEDCYCIYFVIAATSGNRHLLADGVQVSSYDGATASSGIVYYVYNFSGYIKKGTVLRRQDNASLYDNSFRIYKLRH